MPAPVGIFDSGLGGLSVWKEVVKLLPHCSTVYVSDNAYCPYGPRPAEEVIERTKVISRFIIQERCSVIVVACNTATAAAIDALRQTFSIPFVGMEPAVKPAVLHSKSGVVGVLATRGTFKGRLYQETTHRFAADVQVLEQVGDGLVELIEQGLTNAPQTLQLLRTYIEPMMEAGADHLVLGCTHYPFLIPAIRSITGERMAIIDPAPAVARQLCAVLEQTQGRDAAFDPLSGDSPRYKFYSTGDIAALKSCYYAITQNYDNSEFFSCFQIR